MVISELTVQLGVKVTQGEESVMAREFYIVFQGSVDQTAPSTQRKTRSPYHVSVHVYALHFF